MTLLAALAAACAAALLVAPAAGVVPGRRPWATRSWPVVVAAALGVLLTRSVLDVRAIAVGVLVTGCAVVARAWWRRRGRRLEELATADHVLETCETVAAELRAGRPPTVALERAARDWAPLRPVVEAAGLGADLPTALRSAANRPGAGELRLVAAAWQVAQGSGAGLAGAVAAVAASMRAERRTDRLVAGELASARATARLVAALPLITLLGGAGSGADALAFLVGSPVGLGCLVGGTSLLVAGLWWVDSLGGPVGDR